MPGSDTGQTSGPLAGQRQGQPIAAESGGPAPAGRRLIVAIDGPAGAGKSTLAVHLARRFGLLNLETGAMYRALALKAIESDLDFDDAGSMLQLCRTTRIALEPAREGNRVLLDRVDVTRRVRAADVTAAASRVSVHPGVRAWMVEQQRVLGQSGGVVMEGRDIGTAVFPDAEVKIFLDADPSVRGSRRFQQLTPALSAAAAPESEAAIVRELQERDQRDRTRADSPLRPAEDAVRIDSTGMTLDEVLIAAERVVEAVVLRSERP